MHRAQHERRQPCSTFTIGQLAEQTGVSAKTIRYYESIGLLPQPSRGENSYRRYGVADVNRLCLLRRIRLLGLPLSLGQTAPGRGVRRTVRGRAATAPRTRRAAAARHRPGDRRAAGAAL